MKIGDQPKFYGWHASVWSVVEIVKEFTLISYDAEVSMDVKIRIAKPASAFGCLKRSIVTLTCHLQLNMLYIGELHRSILKVTSCSIRTRYCK